MPRIIKKHGKIALVLSLILILIATYVLIPSVKAAGTLPNRSVTLSDSRPGPTITNADYAFKADFTGTPKCIEVVFSAGAVSAGMDTTSATQGADADWGGTPFTKATWADIEKGTNGTVRFWDATGEAGDDAAIFGIGTIQNPTAGVYTAKINTYAPGSCTNAATCCTGTTTDEGTVAFAIISGVEVSATVVESMSFSIDGVADTSCTQGGTATAVTTTSSSIPFSTISSSAYKKGCLDLTVTTNSPTNGYSLTTKEDGKLRISDTVYIEDTDCDDQACTQVVSTAATWTSQDGFGYFCANTGATTDCDTSFTSNKYAQYACGGTSSEGCSSTETPEIFASDASGPINAQTVRVVTKVKPLSTQAAGAYGNSLVFIATPTY